MSRKGKKPVEIPQGVEVKVQNNEVSVKGPKGLQTQSFLPSIQVDVEGNEVLVRLVNPEDRSNFQGLYRTLIENMIIGVTKGFEKKLTMHGVGYRVALKGKSLDFQLGFSHPTVVDIPEHLEVVVEKSATELTVKGMSKQQVGQFAANLRSLRPPEPYKGKGVRYHDEFVRRKAGKSGKK